MRSSSFLALGVLLALAGCGDDDSTDVMGDMGQPTADMDDSVPTPPAYSFESRGEPGTSSVSYSGQTLRQVLVADLTRFVGDLTTLVDGPTGAFDEPAEVLGALNFYYRFDASGEGEPIRLSTTPEPSATTYGEIASARDLAGKLAGQDGNDHADWNAGAFVGWNDATIGGGESPSAFVDALFQALADNAFARVEGTQPTGPDGEELPVHVTGDGLDLQQMIQKFLLMAVNFSQAADDYLDEGLAKSNIVADGAVYSDLEHAWDEGFGYFGAARDYDLYTDDEIAGAGGRPDWQGYHDSDASGAIELDAEYNFGASTNAAKRDRGASTDVDLTAEAFDAFVAGRALMAGTEGELTPEQLDELAGHRDAAVLAWEKAIAATVIHYINDVMGDMDAKEAGEGYVYTDHAKHFSELKGFAMGLQFNPRSPLSDADFAAFHGLVGDRPALDVGTFADYRNDLLAARDILAAAYAFDAADVEGW